MPDLATLDSPTRKPAAASGSQDLNAACALLSAVVAEAGIVRAMHSVINLFSWARSPKGRETLPHVNDDIIEEISFAIEFEKLYNQSRAIQGIARAYKL